MKTILVDAVDGIVIEKDGKFVLFKEMFDLLETYPNPKIILTSANDEQYKLFSLEKMPYPVFTLKHNPEKTDPKYFELMMSKFNLTKDDVIYFEHNPKAAESAKGMDIVAFYYDHEKRDLVQLKQFLDSNL